MATLKAVNCLCGNEVVVYADVRGEDEGGGERYGVECYGVGGSKCGRVGPLADTEDAGVRLWNSGVKAVNMHDRLVAHLAGLLPDCSHHSKTGSCKDCPWDGCETYQLLKEAQGDK
ncbi:MAG: hypothetical protein QGD90_00975 [Candidatus Hydrogenedentes bacterium]|nr:hypothetical protein [Candidatus Hydrogenedentota bacterium]